MLFLTKKKRDRKKTKVSFDYFGTVFTY